MTDIQPMLVFTVSYLFIFFALMGLMPMLAPNLLYGGKGYQNFDVPDYFSSWDLENIKYFEENNLTFPHSIIYFDYNPDINVKLFTKWTVTDPYIRLYVVLWEWWVFFTSERMDFTSLDGASVVNDNYIGKSELLLAWEENFNSSIFTAKAPSGIIKVKCWFTDTNSTRNNISEAWDEGKISLGIGFGMDDVATSYSAFSLIGLLLTFSRPEIFGASGVVAIVLNLIISAPVFLSIAYLIYYFITSIIPFIKGA